MKQIHNFTPVSLMPNINTFPTCRHLMIDTKKMLDPLRMETTVMEATLVVSFWGVFGSQAFAGCDGPLCAQGLVGVQLVGG